MGFAKKNPALGAILFNIIFGFAYLPLKVLTAELEGNTPHLLSFRFGVCFLSLWLLGKLGVVRLRKIRVLLPMAVPLCLMLLLSSFFETFCLLYYPMGKASVILALVPLFSTLFAVFFFREKTGPVQIVFILLAFFGVAVINSGSQDQEATFYGFVLAMIAAVATALLNITIRKSSSDMNVWETSYTMAFAVAVVYTVIALTGFASTGNIAGYFAPLANWKVISGIFFLSVISSLYGNSLRNVVMSHMPMAKASSFTGICTVTSIVLGIVLLGEKFEVQYVIGSALVLAGVLGVNLCQSSGSKAAPTETKEEIINECK